MTDQQARRSMAESLRSASYSLVSYVLTASDHNTHEWMDGLADAINAWAEAVGDEDRCERCRNGLRVVRKLETKGGAK
jgi:hypothetical protein